MSQPQRTCILFGCAEASAQSTINEPTSHQTGWLAQRLARRQLKLHPSQEGEPVADRGREILRALLRFDRIAEDQASLLMG